MLTIQQVGSDILNNTPKSFYVFCGPEYGVKREYLNILHKFYGSKIEADSVQSVLSMMNTKRLIPLKPALYVVRYDESFVSSLSASTSSMISSTNISGTIVCIYEKPSQFQKLDKYLSDYVVSIDSIDKKYIFAHLYKKYSQKIPEDVLRCISTHSTNYNHSMLVCDELCYMDPDSLLSITEDSILRLVNISNIAGDTQIKLGVASRNFSYLMRAIDSYENDLDGVLYTFLYTCIELEKLKRSKSDSILTPYISRWDMKDIYNFYMNVYDTIKKIRSLSCDPYNSVVYLCSLLLLKPIPSLEDITK